MKSFGKLNRFVQQCYGNHARNSANATSRPALATPTNTKMTTSVSWFFSDQWSNTATNLHSIRGEYRMCFCKSRSQSEERLLRAMDHGRSDSSLKFWSTTYCHKISQFYVGWEKTGFSRTGGAKKRHFLARLKEREKTRFSRAGWEKTDGEKKRLHMVTLQSRPNVTESTCLWCNGYTL